MNLIKEYLGSITGAYIFAISGMLILILGFIMIIVHTYSYRKEEFREYSQLPLDDNEDDPVNDEKN